MIKNLILDMDDSLLLCSKYYVECLDEFSEMQSNRTGISKEVCRKVLDNIDLICTELPDGFNSERFPRSFEAASIVLDVVRNEGINFVAARDSYDIGNSVFAADYPLFDGVRETLKLYKDNDFNLFLYSKGDPKVQWPKVHKNNLLEYFPKEHIHFVGRKTKVEVELIMEIHMLHDTETILVGDSLRDDIGSAHAAGLKAVHLTAMKPSWKYENGQNTPDWSIEHFRDLPKIIDPETKGIGRYSVMWETSV
jgi:phosphoglycolate phosphatase-like HAD superfamily hydrolase